MTEHHDLERLLGEAFDAQARAAVPAAATPPPPRFEQPDAQVVPLAPRRRRWLAPLAAAAAVVVAATVGVTIAETQGGGGTSVSSQPVAKAERDAQPVHVRLLNSDGQTYGVGMPVIAYFSRKITDGRAFQAATKATVDGKPLDVAWYFEPSKAGYGPYEAHLRPEYYWPANSDVHVSIATDGASAGKGLGFDNGLTLDFRTGAKNVLLVDDTTHMLKAYSDGVAQRSCRVAMGAQSTPSSYGVKVIMDKQRKVRLTDPHRPPSYSGVPVEYAQRLTYGGEYLIAAPWNPRLVGGAMPTDDSGGSTAVSIDCAAKLFDLTRIGDIVQVASSTGPKMQLGAGYGDWNVAWGQWLTGGVVPTS